MKKIATNIEQSRHLAEILPIESADMVLLHEEPYETSDSKFDGLHQLLVVPFTKYDKPWREKYKNISYFPAWSLPALLDMIQKRGIIIALRNSMLNQQWSVSCDIDDIWKQCKGDTPIDAAFEMVCWLKENKKI